MNLKRVKKLNIPKSSGCYLFKNSAGKIIYIGKAVDLHSRVISYWRKSANHSMAKKKMMQEIKKIEWIETETEIEALLLESNLVKKYQPVFNIDLRDDKRFSYIKISTEDEIPGVFITRKIDKSGKYFGPFTSTGAVRETLKAIRKIWPYCTERKLKKKICFYAQIRRCTGVCGGQFSLLEYKNKIIKPIIIFLSGGKKRIISKLKVKSRKLESILKSINKADDKYEDSVRKLQRIKFQIINIKHVLEHTKILSISEKYAADVVELAKVLGLPKIPKRIEGYDISNIFGREAVGSMVVFSGGEPNKSQYRKFKIKLSQGQANDIFMLREVLARRFNNDWTLPDLIIVDGGKGQLNVATRELKKFKLSPSASSRLRSRQAFGTGISVIAVSKGAGLRSAAAPDKIFFPGEKKALELSLASPALHIIKRVRDEAHRFAIKYHRELRKKNFLK